ncbi:MAG: OmpA family protein [Cyclobacteriaceae bacterium]|nr:OmpA family protein [Cyclobacteriaceae bacterium]
MKKAVFFIIFLLVTFKGVSQHSLVGKEPIFNSYADEQNPVLSPDGRTVYFIRSHHSQNVGRKMDLGDIWYSSLDSTSGKWSSPQNIGFLLNNQFHNGVIGFGLKNEMYLYNIYELDGKTPKSRGVSVVDPIDPPKYWTVPITSTVRYFYNLSDNHSISISDDKKVMMLSLESFKTRGAEDLYVSFWLPRLNAWSEPKNLGDQINTMYQEVTPYLAADNKTLYFSSNGHGGMGSKDIFSSKRLDKSWTNWSKPVNLGPDVNTEGAEMYYQYLADKALAMYTSTKNSDGYGDIHFKDMPIPKMAETIGYEIELPMDTAVFSVEKEPSKSVAFKQILGSIINVKTKSPISATIRISSTGFENNQTLATAYAFDLPSASEYTLVVEADGYISHSEKINISSNQPSQLEHNIELQPIEKGTTVKLDLVLFKRGTTEILEESYEQLDLMIQMMKDNDTMEIELGGHTDNVGNSRLNKKLSQERVDEVVKYFIDNGISSNRLSGKGYGGSKPIASNKSEKTRRLNRRVEFTVVKQ